MTRRTLVPLALAAALSAPPAGAHPHIFIDTGLELIHGPDGTLEALRITWVYDELFSMLLLEDIGLDADFDGVLTAEEETALQGFDMDWPDGYEGDVYLTAAGAPVTLGPPEPGPAALREDGKLVSTHVRRLERPADAAAGPVSVRVYDPTYYTAYSILADGVSTDGAGCSVAVIAPDLDGAYAYLEKAIEDLMAEERDPLEEVPFPAVGDRFAEEVRLTCGDGS